jgi:uncharacterized protein
LTLHGTSDSFAASAAWWERIRRELKGAEMAKQIYVNMPVRELSRSIEFFTRLGYQFDPQFTDENGACMVINESIFVMLLEEGFFSSFTTKPVADARKSTEMILCLSVDSREEVQALVAKAVAAGGTSPLDANDHGFMYQHGFQDLDGHVWEVMYLDAEGPQDDEEYEDEEEDEQ